MSRLARFRSAITGRFVRRGTAQRHPRETVTEQGSSSRAVVWFVEKDMVDFALAVGLEHGMGFDRAHIRKRLGQWERGTWPR